MSEVDDDYSAYVSNGTGGTGEMSQLAKLADQQLAAQRAVEDAETALKKAQDKLKDLKEVQIPNLMEQIGVSSFKLASGQTVEVRETIRASIKEEDKQEAFYWLRKNNCDGIIKRAISVAFGKGEDAAAGELLETLTAQNLPVEDKQAVHPATLSSFVNERLQKGLVVPMELFGVHRQRYAKISK